MKHLCAILLIFCASASAQTIKSLGYNTTNGQVVVATNVVWTNAFDFSTNTVAAQVRDNLELGTNASPAFQAITLGGPNDATLEIINDDQEIINLTYRITNSVAYSVEFSSSVITFEPALGFGEPAATRTNLGLGGGITATNVFVDFSTNTNTVTISNGIITSWTVAP